MTDYIKSHYDYTLLHEFDCNIKPINPNTGHILPFDNELVEIKLIIEVHGQQHYEICGFTRTAAKHSGITVEEAFKYQKWKDKYKKDYALISGYNYLELSYLLFNEANSYQKLVDEKI